MGWVLALTLSWLTTSANSKVTVCYGAWGFGRDTLSPVATHLVREADVVVLAEALDSLPRPTDSTDLLHGRRVEFKVATVFRGEHVQDRLVFPGYLVKHDDLNSGVVPYDDARSAAMSGSCFAFEYRQRAHYLLLLKRSPSRSVVADSGSLTPYWAPLRPTNEQVRGEADPWFQWVRAHLK